jgi:tetratricopeptide (TPR) repeat protein
MRKIYQLDKDMPESLVMAREEYFLTNYGFAEKLLLETLMQHPHPLAHFYLSLILLKKGQVAEALPHIQACLETHSYSADVWDILGLTYYRLQNLAEAEKCFLKAIELEEEFYSPWHNLGLLKFSQQNYLEAEAKLSVALARDAHNPYILHSLGNCWDAQEDYESAIRCYQSALDSEPADPDLLAAIYSDYAETLLQRGHQFYQSEEYDKAKSYYQQALTYSPAHEIALHQLGMCALKQNDALAAQTYFDQLTPKN